MAEQTEYIGTGRRKSAVARVILRPGKGNITVNKKKFEDYFTIPSSRGYILQPLKLTNLESDFDILVTVKGGGHKGQAGALRLGIARALLQYNSDLRSDLKHSSMLVRDARVKERNKPGQPGARKKFQFSKR